MPRPGLIENDLRMGTRGLDAFTQPLGSLEETDPHILERFRHRGLLALALNDDDIPFAFVQQIQGLRVGQVLLQSPAARRDGFHLRLRRAGAGDDILIDLRQLVDGRITVTDEQYALALRMAGKQDETTKAMK